MVRDPALILWLDGQRNTRKAPNENLARELMELFTLGIGNYTEADVKAGARALTGWTVDRATGVAKLDAAPARRRRQDDPRRDRHASTPTAYADLLVRQPATRDVPGAAGCGSGSRPATPAPADTLARLTAAYGAGRDVTALLGALFADPAFAGAAGQLVKQPVEWAVGAMRQLGIRPVDAARSSSASSSSAGSAGWTRCRCARRASAAGRPARPG